MNNKATSAAAPKRVSLFGMEWFEAIIGMKNHMLLLIFSFHCYCWCFVKKNCAILFSKTATSKAAAFGITTSTAATTTSNHVPAATNTHRCHTFDRNYYLGCANHSVKICLPCYKETTIRIHMCSVFTHGFISARVTKKHRNFQLQVKNVLLFFQCQVASHLTSCRLLRHSYFFTHGQSSALFTGAFVFFALWSKKTNNKHAQTQGTNNFCARIENFKF